MDVKKKKVQVTQVFSMSPQFYEKRFLKALDVIEEDFEFQEAMDRINKSTVHGAGLKKKNAKNRLISMKMRYIVSWFLRENQQKNLREESDGITEEKT